MWVHSTTQVKIKGRLSELVFSFYCVGSKDGTQLLGFVVFCFEIASHYVTQAPAFLPCKCWNCRCVHRGSLLQHISTQITTPPISPATHSPEITSWAYSRVTVSWSRIVMHSYLFVFYVTLQVLLEYSRLNSALFRSCWPLYSSWHHFHLKITGTQCIIRQILDHFD